MGSGDSSCCGPNDGPVKDDPYNVTGPMGTRRQNSKEPLLNGDTSGLVTGEKSKENIDISDISDKKDVETEPTAECILTGDITKCKSLDGCIKITVKYNEWLESQDLFDKKTLRIIGNNPNDYNKYISDINNLISPNELSSFIFDANHIKHFHHYDYKQIREYIIDNPRKKHRECSNDNCFNMKYYFLHTKDHNDDDNLLHRLTNLHIFLYHSMFMSQLAIEHIHPRDAYVVINYFERKQRQLNIFIYEKDIVNNSESILDIQIKIIHLISFYYGGKFMEEDDTLDKVSPLGLAQFIEQTMNKATLNQVWSKLDRDGSDTIDIDEVDDILLLTVILSIVMGNKESGDSKAQIDKTELKYLMSPIGDWMKRDKMKEQPVITKEEFRDTFSKWLKEYHKTNGGYIGDEEMQKRLLQKYKIINDEKNGITDKIFNVFKSSKNKYSSDRLIINCEYLVEHKSHQKVNGKDDDDEMDKYDVENGDKSLKQNMETEELSSN